MLRIAICDDDNEVIQELANFISDYGKENDIEFETFYFNDGLELLESNKKFDSQIAISTCNN